MGTTTLSHTIMTLLEGWYSNSVVLSTKKHIVESELMGIKI